MSDYIIWAAVGIALITAELLTGTFYLLVLGAAALIGAVVAFAGASFWLQTLIAAAVAVVGVMWVQQRRRRSNMPAMPSPDLGQPVLWEHWIDESSRIARVRYRGASWEARVLDATGIEPVGVLYISAVDGNTLEVGKNRPA